MMLAEDDNKHTEFGKHINAPHSLMGVSSGGHITFSLLILGYISFPLQLLSRS